MYEASSDARKATTDDTSVGSAHRPRRMPRDETIRARTSSDVTPACCAAASLRDSQPSVLVIPGESVLTRLFLSATSDAKSLVSAAVAAFTIPVTPALGLIECAVAPTMFTMLPDTPSLKMGSVAWMPRK